MVRVFALVMAVVIGLALLGCGGGDSKPGPKIQPTPASPPTTPGGP